MGSISIPVALAVAGAASAGASAFSGANAAGAATSAANTQANAARQAAAIQESQFLTTQANLAPYVTAGQVALNKYQQLTGTGPFTSGTAPLDAPLTRPFQPTTAELANTPGYQFVRDQGLQATQNSFAAQGLGSSGAALKGAANYAEGLAGTTYQQQFQNYLQQNAQIAGLVGGPISIGENAAAQTGNIGMQTAAGVGNTLTSGAAASAAGQIGAANAVTNGLGGLASAGSNTALLLALNNNGLFGNPNPSATTVTGNPSGFG